MSRYSRDEVQAWADLHGETRESLADEPGDEVCGGSGEVMVAHSGHHPNDPACQVVIGECRGCVNCDAPAVGQIQGPDTDAREGR